jgi:membrane protein YdbS with pleckstrin-like domain
MSATRPDEPDQEVRPAPALPIGPGGESEQEVDVWWGAYSGRAIIPTALLCTVLSVNIALLAGWVWDKDQAPPQLLWHLTALLVVLVWAFPLLLCGYRAVAFNYRLTTHRLFRDRGFRHPPADGAVDLAEVTAVRVAYPPLGRLYGVGTIEVEAEGARRPLVLIGVSEPERVAELVRRGARRARERHGGMSH